MATKFKTHVILGDSISDSGGEAPYFAALLDQDLRAACPDLVVVKASKNGAMTADLAAQVRSLPPLVGPVLVTITIGSNDVAEAMAMGGDDTQRREEFAKRLHEGLSELTKSGRLSEGSVIALANIYDSSDGTGVFVHKTGKHCLGFPDGLNTGELLVPWNAVSAETAAAFTDVTLVDMHARFRGHGVGSSSSWFAEDCIHPNTAGGRAIRDLFWEATMPGVVQRSATLREADVFVLASVASFFLFGIVGAIATGVAYAVMHKAETTPSRSDAIAARVGRRIGRVVS